MRVLELKIRRQKPKVEPSGVRQINTAISKDWKREKNVVIALPRSERLIRFIIEADETSLQRPRPKRHREIEYERTIQRIMTHETASKMGKQEIYGSRIDHGSRA
jgi:hypothetical protein